MFCFLICAAFSSVTIDLKRRFHTLYTNATESYVVEPTASKRVFFFVQDTADSVWVTVGEETPVSVTRPYALAVTQSAMVNVSTSSSASVIVMVASNNECENGAYYTAGGQTVKVEADRLYWKGDVSRYCVFSPSTDNQTLNVQVGLRDMSEGLGDAVKVTYMRSDGSPGYEYCYRSTYCTRSLKNAYYYVSYERVQHSASQKLYYKRSQTFNDEYTNCTSRTIPYYPAGSGSKPYDIERASRYCRDQAENEKQTNIAVAVGVTFSLLFLFVVLIILVKTRCCGHCSSYSHATITDSLMNNTNSTYQPSAYPPAVDYAVPPNPYPQQNPYPQPNPYQQPMPYPQPSPYLQPGQYQPSNPYQPGPDQNRVYV